MDSIFHLITSICLILSDTSHALGFAKLTFSSVSPAFAPFNYSIQAIILSILTYLDWLSQYYFNSQYYAVAFNLTVFT